MPVVEGRDGRRQGAYARGDLRGAVRVGVAVPWLGVSGLRQAPHTNGRGALWELAAVAGASFDVSKRTGLSAQARVPLWTDASERYVVAPGLSVRHVFGTQGGDAP